MRVMRFQKMARAARREDLLAHHFDVNHAFADGLSDGGAEHEERKEFSKAPRRRREWRMSTRVKRRWQWSWRRRASPLETRKVSVRAITTQEQMEAGHARIPDKEKVKNQRSKGSQTREPSGASLRWAYTSGVFEDDAFDHGWGGSSSHLSTRAFFSDSFEDFFHLMICTEIGIRSSKELGDEPCGTGGRFRFR